MLTFQPRGLHQCMEETGGSVIYTQEMTSGWPTRLNLTLHSLVYLLFFFQNCNFTGYYILNFPRTPPKH